MKKLLGIVVLGLLWFNVAFGMTEEEAMSQLSKKSLDPIEGIWDRKGDTQGRFAIIKTGNSIEVISLQKGELFQRGATAAIISKNSSNKYSGQMFATWKGQAINANLVFTMSGSDRFIEVNTSKYGTTTLQWKREWPIDFESHNAKFKSQDEQEEKKLLVEMVNDAKKTCKVLGFDEKSEKFADCTLKLYTQKVDELVAEKQLRQQQVNSSVSTNQSSGSNVTTIYDPVRDSQNLMNKGQKMLSGGCTLGVDC